MVKLLGIFLRQNRLRQGDPLSTCLFIIGLEGLSNMLINVENTKSIHGIKVVPTAPSITHLCFANDLLLFYHANDTEINFLRYLLDRF